MIYIVERPHQNKSFAWTAADKRDFINKVSAANERRGDTIYEAQTMRQAAETLGIDPTSQEELVEYGLADMVAKHGLDTVFYKGYLDANWSITAVDEFEQYALACAHDLYACHIYLSETEAVEALRSGELDSGHNVAEGRSKLIKLLVRHGDQIEALLAIGLKDELAAMQLLDIAG